MANIFPIKITEGASFGLSMVLSSVDDLGVKTPINLTGYTIKSQIRKNYTQTSPVIREFLITILNPEKGEFSISLTDEETADIKPTPAPPSMLAETPLGYYDIFMTAPTGTVSLLLQGPVTYIQTITRDTP